MGTGAPEDCKPTVAAQAGLLACSGPLSLEVVTGLGRSFKMVASVTLLNTMKIPHKYV